MSHMTYSSRFFFIFFCEEKLFIENSENSENYIEMWKRGKKRKKVCSSLQRGKTKAKRTL